MSGRVQRDRFTDRDGTERVQFQVVVDNLVSARTVRPRGGGRKTKSVEGEGEPIPETTPEAAERYGLAGDG